MEPIRNLDDYQRLYRRSVEQPAAFWTDEAQLLSWFHPFDQVVDFDLDEVDFCWFDHGRINAAYNCVDRHAIARPGKIAIRWVGNSPGERRDITYRELKHGVARVANVLRAHGVVRGDRVCLYMPMIPEAVYAMLACARIGAVHSVVFAGFSADSLRDRILDAGCKVVITADEGPRGPKRSPLKEIVDQAIAGLDLVRTVLVARRTGAAVEMKPGRDHFLDLEMAKQRSTCPVEWMSPEDPLFILYTSGSTGKPKGVMHTTGGYLVHAVSSYRRVFDYRDGDIHFCTADIGWITGHTYIVYGPLAAGSTVVVFEGTPTWPDPSRLWQVVDEVGATVLYTAPTALRALIHQGDEWLKGSSRRSLRVLGTVGEPINPEVWTWYHEQVGEGRCGVVDTWWQTETGGIMITPLAGVTPTVPGSATLPYLGIEPVLVDDAGGVLEGPGSGNLCIARPWPGQARTIWGDHRRYRETYFSRFPTLYFTGDGATRDDAGRYWITGRVDDVLNVSGHRLGTAEIESALVAHEAVSEAAVVGFPHDLKGTGICAYVTIKSGERGDPLASALVQQVRRAIGAIAAPDRIVFVSGLPKTRSGKIMRRILRKVACGDTSDLGDITTLADPAVIPEILESARRAEVRS